jgi:hypothetical protein
MCRCDKGLREGKTRYECTRLWSRCDEQSSEGSFVAAGGALGGDSEADQLRFPPDMRRDG